MSRIHKKFLELKQNRRKALILYMTAGDPSLKKNESLALAFEKNGVDLIELGVPFSDPLADGPVIQAASERSLRRKTTLKKILTLVEKIRREVQIPIVLMSYLNPILQYGFKKFAEDARRTGVDGLIVPDLPPDEAHEIMPVMHQKKIDLIFLMAPTSPTGRLKMIGQSSKGFIYYVSIAGVTGIRGSLPKSLDGKIKTAKRYTRLPVCVGFGVSTSQQAQAIAKTADGVIIGSAIVKALAEHPKLSAGQFAARFVRPFAKVLRPSGIRRRSA